MATTSSGQDRAALGAFLRSRRDRLTPARAGMDAFPGPRRVPGLRKEELAMLAGLSADYYSRVEQGRQAHVSREVLGALARALRLDEVETAHLHDLADPAAQRPLVRRVTGHEAPQRPDPGLVRIMDAMGHLPVLLIGRRGEILARNALLPVVLGASLEPGSSLMRWLFLDPLARERIANWEVFAQASVGALRRESARRPDDRTLERLVDEVRHSDPDIARWWDDQGVRDYASVAKRIRHPVAGDLDFDIEIVSGTREPDQRLIVYTVQVDSPTARMLPLLASWAGELALTAGPSPARP
ncbi:DNA-binding protein [Frondihabitans sp. PAMC 28766]|uniref:helix-turn-helix transcriptional regulator n=1 Tax=Frondihabitans sp. PAMC 28766 TaxID=1795630 RepID=UPI00078B61A5|nr:helix-turn-helix transcriptional regulator [Frondihabitans sp. PAMC 28766]AMM22382.1 DNA-binding protein [Frondihabitans sp. PAMC 28766]